MGKKMYLCSNLYFGSKASENQKELLKSIKHRKCNPGVYVVTLAENGNNLLDIYEVLQLNQPYFRKKCIRVVGIALGKEEALDLVTAIIDHVHRSTGGFNVREYFLTDKG